jgi:hypothetical protein
MKQFQKQNPWDSVSENLKRELMPFMDASMSESLIDSIDSVCEYAKRNELDPRALLRRKSHMPKGGDA